MSDLSDAPIAIYQEALESELGREILGKDASLEHILDNLKDAAGNSIHVDKDMSLASAVEIFNGMPQRDQYELSASINKNFGNCYVSYQKCIRKYEQFCEGACEENNKCFTLNRAAVDTSKRHRSAKAQAKAKREQVVTREVTVKLPTEFNKICVQFLYYDMVPTPLSAEELLAGAQAHAEATANDVDQDGNSVAFDINTYEANNVRYRYSDYPGIRAVKNIAMNMKRATNLYQYNQNYPLIFMKNLLADHPSLLCAWNTHHGHGNPIDSRQPLPDSNAVQIRTLDIGPQAPKFVPETVHISSPILFHPYTHDGNGLSQGLLREGDLKISVEFNSSNQVLIAEYYDGVSNPWVIGCPKVEIKNLRIKGEYSAYLGDLARVIQIATNSRSVIRGTESNSVEVCKVCPKTGCVRIPVNSQQLAESMYIAVRPKGYCEHFDLWSRFGRVNQLCHTMTVFVNNETTGATDVFGFSPSFSYEPQDVVKEIGVSVGNTPIKQKICPRTYRELTTWTNYNRNARHGIIRRDTKEAFLIKFNNYYPQMKFDNFMNFATSQDFHIDVAFEDDSYDLNGDFVYTSDGDHINQNEYGYEVLYWINYIDVISEYGANRFREYGYHF